MRKYTHKNINSFAKKKGKNIFIVQKEKKNKKCNVKIFPNPYNPMPRLFFIIKIRKLNF